MSEKSNREALRRLSRKLPPPREIKKIIDNLRDEKDISVAIVGAALLEASLEELLKKRFASKNPSLIGRVFLNQGPLQDFDSKILVAECMGIITSSMAEEMRSIKAIRNTFAHSKMFIDFGNDLIAREVGSMRMLMAMRRQSSESGVSITQNNKSSYLLVIQLMMIVIDEIGKRKGTANSVIGRALARHDGKRRASS